MKKTYLLFALFIAFHAMQAEENLMRVCGQDDLVKHFRQINPNYDTEVKDLFQEFYQNQSNARLMENTGMNDTIYTVRVVVHIVYLKDDSLQNIPDTLVYSQIAALNRDYMMENEDTINLRPIFNKFRGNPKIHFELTTTDPNGNATTGIVRVAAKAPSIPPANAIDSLVGSTDNWFKNGFQIKTIGNAKDTTIGSKGWDNKKYLNIWVTNLNIFRDVSKGTLGGFAFAPPGLSNWPMGIGYPSNGDDGVSIDYRFFGQNNYFAQARPDKAEIIGKGRTTVHEVGHYLGLRHIWGDYGNLFGSNCNNLLDAILFFNDGIDDTPVAKSPFASTIGEYRCDTTVNTCNMPYQGVDYPDMFENYMDYSGDNCYNLFTKQQIQFIRMVLRTRRAGIISNKTFNLTTAIRPTRLNEMGISVFPNPIQESIAIQIEKPLFKEMTVQLFDISGKQVLAKILSANSAYTTLDTHSLSSGTYFIRCFNEDFMVTDKLIKQ